MKQGLSLRVSQHLALTPQLQQSIRLLQLSTLELSQEVDQMLDDNPFLERTQDDAPREDFGLAQADTRVTPDDRESEVATTSIADYAGDSGAGAQNDSDATPLSAEDMQSWDGDGTVEMAPDDSEWGSDAKAHTNNLGTEDDVDATELARQQESLQTHLHRQAIGLRLSDEDRVALRFLIESLNDDGYLEDSLLALAQGLAGVPVSDPEDDPRDELSADPHEDDPAQAQVDDLVHHFTVALRLLQSLEPVGVGARDLAECLCLQLRAIQAAISQPATSASADSANSTDSAQRNRTRALAQAAFSSTSVAVALRICQQPMDFLARRDVKRLAQLCPAPEADVRDAIALIARLEPKPGRRFVDVERNVVVPDVLVIKLGSGSLAKFRVQLNADVMPRLRVHDIYANALKGHRSGGRDASNFVALQQRLQEARWFIKNIQQRFDTILRVSNAIVERQKNFFMHGELAMRPLVLREIADELNLHESTISRVTTAKYMATPFGTFELKYFFGSGLGTESGGNASSTAVRALIKQFVAAESLKKPLSDSQLSLMLKEQGIECARRTVAKYREALKIAPTNLRKTL